MTTRIFFTSLIFSSVAFAGTAEDDWKSVIALDAGPQTQARTDNEAKAAISTHLAAQERALRTFLSAHGDDSHALDARLRLAQCLALRGDFQNDAKARGESERIFESLEKSATPDQRADVDFARLSLAMRRANSPSTMNREALLARAQKFQAAHPEDRRVPQILVEIATLFDSQPTIKQKLLLEAQPLAKDEQTKARIADDLKRVELLGQPLALTAPGNDGKPVDLAEFRGKIVIVSFFATWSPQSMLALDSLKNSLAPFKNDAVQLLGVCLDTKAEPLGELLKTRVISWPVMRDGKGWESPLIRGLGINALPTVWLVDREGKLRSLDALENTSAQIQNLLREK